MIIHERNLRIPGPTPLPPEVRKVMGRDVFNHRGQEFADIIIPVTEKLKYFFQTQNDVLVLTGSGTAGLEAAIVNTLSPRDKVLAVSIGDFGDRFADIASDFGADVKKLDFEWGQTADPSEIAKELEKDNFKAVLITHNETSTGVTNDLESIAGVVRQTDSLLLVDAISSLGCIDLKADDWRCDVVVTASQKGWQTPPALTMVSVSQKAWQAAEESEMPKHYLSFQKARTFLEKGQTPFTPAVLEIAALNVALEMMMNEGLENIIERHKRLADLVRRGVEELGFELFARREYASDTVTAVKSEEADRIRRLLLEQGIEVAGGQGKLRGKIFRIGHLGYVTEDDINQTLEVLSKID